ncbi:MAG TPA: penicillin acylase family protein [Solirubrobacteraceae bacterium]|nr:penicillin acylase family protein [Solirubrobacteraceae bacterium]
MRLRIPVLLAALAAAAATAAPAGAQSPYLELRGALHEHSAYSDGWPGTRPADYFESARRYGLDFLGSGEHSTNIGLPSTFSEACYGEGRGGEGEVLLAECVAADGANSLRKWDATQEQADAATTGAFVAFRGFEWSSDRFGHINVYLSRNWNHETAGYASMEPFWRWFTTPPALDGGADGLGTFNHPGAKKLDGGAVLNWNRFAHVPAADDRMVGLEVFNDRRDYGSDGGHAAEGGAYAFALDRGWHVGAIGAEDLGHRKPPLDDWGGPTWPKTVLLAHARTRAAIREALMARRFYALGPDENALRLTFAVDGREMGSRLVRTAGRPLTIAATTSDPALRLELVTSGGRVVASGTGGALKAERRAAPAEPWYFLRARRGERPVAYSSPVWVEPGAASGEWLAGDGHVHTCYSHDAYCPQNDPPQDADTFYSSFATVAQRFTEAAAKGLDYLVISDHDAIDAWSDPDFGSHGVTGVKAYEWSLDGGHAQMLGATREYGKSLEPNVAADLLNADGGLFQANHPSYRAGRTVETCEQAMAADTALHWKLGFSVRPDVVEVWNPTALIPPAEVFWDCWLQRGGRMPATAGSDSHGATQPSVGLPTTWVLARDRRQESILLGMRLGRTTLSRLPPALGGPRLLLEADRNRDGTYESMMGDAVPPGTPMRVRADGLSAPGFVRVRANGRTLLEDEPLAPGGQLRFGAPKAPGYVRAVLYQQQATGDVDPACRPPVSEEAPLSFCSTDLAISAMTSPIYLEAPGAAPPKTAPAPVKAVAATSAADEPDDDGPLPPALQSHAGADRPRAPRALVLERAAPRRAGSPRAPLADGRAVVDGADAAVRAARHRGPRAGASGARRRRSVDDAPMRLTLLGAIAALLIVPCTAAAQFDATIRRTDHGIPHITAKDYASLGYGYGYAFAEDNLCVIAEQYVTVRGERSKFFGPNASWAMRSNGTTNNNLNSDFFFKRIIAQGTVEKLIDQPPPNGPRPEVREAVRGYVAGYNRYLQDVGVANLPDKACRGAEWVRPIEEIDAYRRFYQLALLASSGVSINGIGGAQPPTPAGGGGGGGEGGAPVPTPSQLAELEERLPLGGIGSNAYGIGREQTDNGKGMLLGNPHFPWDGAERFYQAHATIPGKLDVAGGSLFGVPVVLIGHTRGLAWSHTVSTAYRFTPFELKLVPGSPTTYLVDGRPREMTRTELTVEVRNDDGTISERTRTLYDTEYGPVFTELIGQPLFPWTPAVAFAMGDANAANFRYLNHFFETNHAQSVREYHEILRRNQGIPWVNSIAADAGGEAYYADISVVPHVTDDHADACNTAVGRATFAALRLPALDGSRSACRWGSDPSAIQPGTFGPDEHLPFMFRTDYVMNANDSYWLGNLKQRLEGFPLIVGNERTARALRTRIGLLMVDGEQFTLQKLQDTVFDNRQYAGELWMPEVRSELCASGDQELAAPCAALEKWNVRDDLDSEGALLFRRFAQRLNVGQSATSQAGPPPFEVPYDNDDPANTPRGLRSDDPRVRQALVDAAAELEGLGIALDARLGDVQAEVRGEERIPIHGGPGTAGVFNAINVGPPGRDGIVNVPHGSSFVQAVQFVSGRCPVEPRTILTYSQSTNPDSPFASDQTRLFSRKEWVDAPFCGDEVRRETIATTELRSEQRGAPESCRSAAGFRRVSARSRRTSMRFRWETRAGGPVQVDVFRVTRGSRALRRSRRVARFTARDGLDGANFRGRGLRGAGVFVARFRARGVFGGTDTRRLAFRRTRRGRFLALPRFERESGCDLLRSFRLSAPVFDRRGLAATFRAAQRVEFELRDGERVVYRGLAQQGRFRLAPGRRGRHRFRLVVRDGERTVVATLTARRL